MLNLALALISTSWAAPTSAMPLQPNQSQLISFQSNFEPIGKVVERISSQTSIPMSAFSGIKNYPIYINVKNVPLMDLLTKVADLAGAQWEKKGDNWFLSADQSLKKEQERAGDADMIAAIEATISKEVKKPKTATEIEQGIKKAGSDPSSIMNVMGDMFGGMFEADQATFDLLRMIGAKELSSIVDGRRVVLSSSPNLMQVQMNAKAINAIRAHVKKMCAEAIAEKAKNEAKKPKKVKTPDGDEFEMPDMDFGSLFGGGNGVKKPELGNQIGIVMASFQVTNRNTLNVEIGAYSDKGIGIYKKTVQLSIENPEEKRDLVKGTTNLNIAQSAKEYAQGLIDGENIDPLVSMMTNMNGNMSTMLKDMFSDKEAQDTPSAKPLSEAIRAQMLDPIANEPLAKLLGPILDIEATRGKNVVALPSDAVFKTLARSIVDSNSTLEGVLDAIDRTISQEVTQDGTWTVVKSSSPLELRSAFCNRVALGNLLKSGKSKGYLNLDDCAKFAVAQDNARGSEALALPLTTAALRASDLGSVASLTSLGFDALKFYASMTDFQKQSLNAKRPVALASLLPVQRDVLSRMVFNGPLPPMALDNEMAKAMQEMPEATGDDSEMGGMAAFGMAMAGSLGNLFGGGDSKITDERTALLPNGIPVVGTLSMRTFNSQALMATNTKNGTSTITVPELLAMGESQSPIPFFKTTKREYDQYKLARQQSFFLSFQFGNTASYFFNLYDVSVDQSKTYTKSQLPQKIQDKLKPMDFGIPNQRGNTPPPTSKP